MKLLMKIERMSRGETLDHQECIYCIAVAYFAETVSCNSKTDILILVLLVGLFKLFQISVFNVQIQC